MAHYNDQARGSDSDYAAYFAGMNASMQQKVALTTAHFPPRGIIADMGSGSGAGSHDLAALHDGLEVVGVDINPDAVRIAGETHQRRNLRFQLGDIAAKIFSDGFLDAVLDSSVLHHVTSFNDFSLQALATALDNQVRALKPGGVLVVRDFVVPDGPSEVFLDLPESDGAPAGTIAELSSAALFERFAATFRSSLNRKEAVPYTRLASASTGWSRYQVSLRAATEFVLRKDYRDHWDVELQEEYLYYSQAQFERAFAERGLCVVASFPIYNPWIVEHRFVGKFVLRDLNGGELPYPPTNFLIVAEKVGPRAGVRLEAEPRETLPAPKFIKLSAYQNRQSHKIFELCERPHPTVDVVPWFSQNGRCFVLAKHGFPRPLANLGEDANLTATHLAGYVTEPLAAIVGDQTIEGAAARVLRERAGWQGETLPEVTARLAYYPSPGGLSERVEALCVAIAPRFSSHEVENYTSFTTSGTVRPLEATQLLRAFAIGGMFDARLELNVFHLLHTLGLPFGPWIGGDLSLTEQAVEGDFIRGSTFVRATDTPAFSRMLVCPQQFLGVHVSAFVERDAQGTAISEAKLEWVRPQNLSTNTMSVLPIVRTRQGALVGLQWRSLPAPEVHGESAWLCVVPAMRLPRAVQTWPVAVEWATERLSQEFGLAPRRTWQLGGRYFPSLGMTPEIVHPLLVEVDARSLPKAHGLEWFPLEQALGDRLLVRDAHTLVSLFRAGHALGAWPAAKAAVSGT